MAAIWAVSTALERLLPPNPPKVKYAYWRKDIPVEEGFSPELISMETLKIIDNTDLDRLESEPFPGVNTMWKGMQRNLTRIPNHPLLGTKNKATGKYEWLTWADSMKIA